MQRHQYFTNTYRRKEPGEWGVGRIYQTRGGPDSLALVLVVDRQRSDDAQSSNPLPRKKPRRRGLGSSEGNVAVDRAGSLSLQWTSRQARSLTAGRDDAAAILGLRFYGLAECAVEHEHLRVRPFTLAFRVRQGQPRHPTHNATYRRMKIGDSAQTGGCASITPKLRKASNRIGSGRAPLHG